MSPNAARRGSRVVATGYGVITSIATNGVEFVRALRSGVRGMGPVTLFDVADQRTSIAAEVKGFEPNSVLPPRLRNIASRSDALGFVAADEAVRHSRLAAGAVRRAAIVVGGTTGGMLEAERGFAHLADDTATTLALARMFSHPLSSPADRIAFALGLQGPRRSVCTACSSGSSALAIASDLLRRGDCDAVIAGGTDSVCKLTYTGFNALGAIDPLPCRPFDATRSGLSLGEGAAFLVLERIEDATARGATLYGEIFGVGAASEAHHITNPQSSGEGAARAISLALADAGIEPDRVDYINAHGTATPLNDAMESAAIRAVFGSTAERVWVSSTKSLVGHTLGAAGAIEAVVCLIAVEHGFIPPTAGLSQVDPQCALRHVAIKSVETRVDVCLSNSFGFGGNNTVVCLGRPDSVLASRRNQPRARSVVVTGLGAFISVGTGHESLVSALSTAPADSGQLYPIADASASIDRTRARRQNRFARIATAVVSQAMSEAKFTVDSPLRVGASIGTAWGIPDDTAAFMRRVAAKGARLALPAEFPNLVLSSAVGHVSIYHGFKGPTLTAIAGSASGEAAFVIALEEIATGRADSMAAAAVEERNPLVLRFIDALDPGPTTCDATRAPRTEGAACLFLEAEDTARARGAPRALARVAGWHQATFAPPLEFEESNGESDFTDAVARAVERAMNEARIETVDGVVVSLATAAIRRGLASSHARDALVYEVAPRVGFFEGIGAVVLACAAALAAGVPAPRAVVAVGTAPGSVFAVVFTPSDPEVAAPNLPGVWNEDHR